MIFLKDSIKRRSARTLLDILFNSLIKWLAPSLVFTCEEAWKSRGNQSSIHLEDFNIINEDFKNEIINKKWKIIKDVRKVITGAIEVKRSEKLIRSSLEASMQMFMLILKSILNLKNFELSEIAITSNVNIIETQDHQSNYVFHR